jgi:hypothetical protein
MKHCRTIQLCTLAVLGSNLGACASIDSRPQPLWTEKQAYTAFQNCDLATASDVIKTADDNGKIASPVNCGKAVTDKEARNRFITGAMDLIDTRYKDFVIDLSREAKGSNLGFNFIALALTAGGAVAGEKTANALASGTTAILGTRDSFNKDVLLEQTIAALIDEMFAMRADARASLLTGMKADYKAYPLEQAARDIAAYDEAADLNRAIQRLVRAAAERADKAEAREEMLKASIQGCVPMKNTFVPRYRIKKFLDGISNDAAGDGKVANLAISVGIDAKGKGRQALTDAILEKLSAEACTLDQLTEIATAWDPSLKLTGD